MVEKPPAPARLEVRAAPVRLLVIISLSVFAAEALVMILLAVLPLMSEWMAIFLDALLATTLVIPILYFYSVRPMARQIAERIRAEDALRKSHEEIERLYKAELYARQTAETLRAASLALTQTLVLDTVLDTLLDYLQRVVPYDSANVLLMETESRLAVRATRGYEQWGDLEQMRKMTFDAETDPVIRTLLATRKTMLVEDTREYAGWEQHACAGRVLNWLGVPLVAEDRVIGLYALEKAEPRFFAREHLQLAEALIGQVAVAIQNAWLFEQVRTGRERLQSLSRRLVEAQESERRYIARELHDEAGQALTTLMFGLHMLEQEAHHPEQVVARVAELKQMTDSVSENLHRLAMDLRPASLDHIGLAAALLQYTKTLGERTHLKVQFKTVGFDGERLPPAIETALYRIVQEALTNVVRHAQATRVDVILELRAARVAALVEDNGVGFDPEAALSAQGGRLGLLGVRERAETLGGTLEIESAAGMGTTVVVEVPL